MLLENASLFSFSKMRNGVGKCCWKMLLENAVTVEKCIWKMQMENAAGNACLFSTEVPNMLSF